ncbi:MAG TPA: ABC transporter permease subunit, partial [Anaerolineales bacterium]|nr:ABC transporter permease subunit [Anaerolineales bacterium]
MNISRPTSARAHLSTVPLWILPLTFLAFFFFFPLARISFLTFSASTFNVENLHSAQRVAWFTFYQAALSTLLTLFLGIPSAVLFSRFDFRGKALLRALVVVPFLLPTVVVATAFTSLVGPRGLFSTFQSSLFPFSSFAFHPSPFVLILAAHVFYNVAIVIRIVGAALSNLNPKLEDTARSLGADPLRVWLNVIVP